MAIKSKNKIEAGFSMSSMSDLVFLLLIFFMITSTQISPNALKLLLPKSNSQTSSKTHTTISITKELILYVEDIPVDINTIEAYLKNKLQGQVEPVISLHVDQSVPIQEVVKVMNIAYKNKYKLILATSPE